MTALLCLPEVSPSSSAVRARTERVLVGLSRGQLDWPWRVESLALVRYLLRALRSERRER